MLFTNSSNRGSKKRPNESGVEIAELEDIKPFIPDSAEAKELKSSGRLRKGRWTGARIGKYIAVGAGVALIGWGVYAWKTNTTGPVDTARTTISHVLPGPMSLEAPASPEETKRTEDSVRGPVFRGPESTFKVTDVKDGKFTGYMERFDSPGMKGGISGTINGSKMTMDWTWGNIHGTSRLSLNPDGALQTTTGETYYPAARAATAPSVSPPAATRGAPTTTTAPKPVATAEKAALELGATYRGPTGTFTVTKMDAARYEGTMTSDGSPLAGTVRGAIDKTGIDMEWKWGSMSGKERLNLAEDGTFKTPAGATWSKASK